MVTQTHEEFGNWLASVFENDLEAAKLIVDLDGQLALLPTPLSPEQRGFIERTLAVVPQSVKDKAALLVQRANAAKPQPVNDSAEERQKQNEEMEKP
jgi:hypothetical protein